MFEAESASKDDHEIYIKHGNGVIGVQSTASDPEFLACARGECDALDDDQLKFELADPGKC